MNRFIITMKAAFGKKLTRDEVSYCNQKSIAEFETFLYPQTAGQRWWQFLSISAGKAVMRLFGLKPFSTELFLATARNNLDVLRSMEETGVYPSHLLR